MKILSTESVVCPKCGVELDVPLYEVDGVSHYGMKFCHQCGAGLFSKTDSQVITREDLCDVVKEVYEDTDKFLNDVEEESIYRFSVFCTINDSPSDGDILILDNDTDRFISWYKLAHVGRDLHTNITSEAELLDFISTFKECKNQEGYDAYYD